MHIRECQRSDLPAYADVHVKSIWNDEGVRQIAPKMDQYPHGFRLTALERDRRRFYSGQWMIVAVTDENDAEWNGTEKIIGYSAWSTTMQSVATPRPGGWMNGFEKWVADRVVKYLEIFAVDRSAAPKVRAKFEIAVGKIEEKTFGPWPDRFELTLLGTDPNFQRRGVGRALLQWGFDKAVQYGVPIVVIGTNQGENLYRKYGFKLLDRVDHEGIIGTWAAMVWHPGNAAAHSAKVGPQLSGVDETPLIAVADPIA